MDKSALRMRVGSECRLDTSGANRGGSGAGVVGRVR